MVEKIAIGRPPQSRICPGCKRVLRWGAQKYTAVNPETDQVQRVCTWCKAAWAHLREVTTDATPI